MKKVIIFLGLAFMFILNINLSYAGTCQYNNHSLRPRYGYIFTTTQRPTFSWEWDEVVPGAVRYNIEVSDCDLDNPDYGCTYPVYEEVTTASFRPSSNLEFNEPGKSYYWRIRAMVLGEGGRQIWCANCSQTFSFRVWPAPQPWLLVLPENRARIGSRRPEFRWVDYLHYGLHRDKIQVSTDSSFRTIVFEDTVDAEGEVSFICPVDLEYDQTYYWRVRFESWGAGYQGDFTFPGSWSNVYSFDVFLPLPPQVFLISPGPGSYVSTSIEFSWNEIPAARGYELVVSESEDFSSTALRLFPTTNSVTTPFRKPDGRYYWRVRAHNASGYGPWSPRRSFIKSSCVPEAVSLRRPENEAVLHDIRPLFEWEGSTGYGRDNYHLQISSVSNFATTVINKSDIPEESTRLISPIDLLPHTTYYWRMRRHNLSGWGPWSEVRSFRIDLSTVSSARVSLSRPSDGQTLNRVRERFSWSSEPSRCQRYHIQVSEASNFADLFYESTLTDSSVFIWLEDNKTYYWRVRAEDEIGWGPWSEVRSFSVSSAILARPELIFPEGQINTSRPEFSWRGFAETAYRSPVYHIQISFDPEFSYCYIDYDHIHTTTFTPSRLPTGYDRYYWRVRGRERPDSAWCPWSDAKSFWISITPIPITLDEPEADAIVKTRRPRFSWRAITPFTWETEFEVEVSDRRDFSTSVFRTSTSFLSVDSPFDLADGIYFWHVRQAREGTWGTWTEARSFSIDTTPPEIRIIAPTERKISTRTIPARVNVSCEVTDNLSGIEKVEFYLGRRKAAERNRPYEGSMYVAEVTGLQEGRNTITVRAYDKSDEGGNIAEESFTIEVERILGIKRPSAIPEDIRKTLPEDVRRPRRMQEKIIPKR